MKNKQNSIDSFSFLFSDAEGMEEEDTINKPRHYTHMHADYEPIKVIEAWDLNYHLGNVLKYISRAGIKNPSTEVEDLKKARWYLNRHINNLE